MTSGYRIGAGLYSDNISYNLFVSKHSGDFIVRHLFYYNFSGMWKVWNWRIMVWSLYA